MGAVRGIRIEEEKNDETERRERIEMAGKRDSRIRSLPLARIDLESEEQDEMER